MARGGLDDSTLVRAIRSGAQIIAQAMNSLGATLTEAVIEGIPGVDSLAQVTIGKNDERMISAMEAHTEQLKLNNLYLAQILGHTFEEGDDD